MSVFIDYPYLGYFLSRIDFPKIHRRMIQEGDTKIVLMEYRYSRVNDPVFQAEYIPNTKVFVHHALSSDFLEVLKKVIGIENVVFYTRRKIVNGELTNVRQFVMHYDPYMDMPPLI